MAKKPPGEKWIWKLNWEQGPAIYQVLYVKYWQILQYIISASQSDIVKIMLLNDFLFYKVVLL